MRTPTFEQLCKTLATIEDYALWIGAGASIASAKGKTPSWSGLVADLVAAVPAGKRPAALGTLTFPDQLEFLGGYMGHGAFRKALRAAIVDPMLTVDFDTDVMLDQATIAARASAIVSFNIETISAVPFSMAKGGGSFNPRSYVEPGPYQFLRLRSYPGAASLPVYFPHGLLDLTGRCVMTSSEYALQGISLAVGTAVSVCLGGNLLILGMSLADKYLRDAILSGRRWLRNIYWVGKVEEFQFREWARVADVHLVDADHAKIWSGLAGAMLEHEKNEGNPPKMELSRHRSGVKNGLPGAIDRVRMLVGAGLRKAVEDVGRQHLPAHFKPSDLQAFAREIENFGLDVPDFITNDPRYSEAP